MIQDSFNGKLSNSTKTLSSSKCKVKLTSIYYNDGGWVTPETCWWEKRGGLNPTMDPLVP